ncbi:nucleoside hydrolase [Tetragenococcus muriaticus]|uniref:Inosine-uridine preferring nucleoside hydrolase n=1 Tax=Tetragenococcus muriaticus 3MR10-3 TaxID=1302648 RepID=A0A091BYI8_9ENTE|nr:nucleoside hydrolase [Tetragenococcus muriaticus]KFN89535.1 inosine-uridine preferring nucleoside hydrolase [Tetragenococcus muriaticus 3MR10-3]
MKKLILDIDTGIDDAMALAYSAGAKKIDLIGVVGTYGNVYTQQSVQNTLNILDMIGKVDIPVYEGEPHAIAKNNFKRSEIGKKTSWTKWHW